MKKIDVTFGIPLYNAEKYIDDLFDCFKSSNGFNYEIIVVDDGSTDKSLILAQNFKVSNPKLDIRVFSKKNGGVSQTRNYIINKAEGKFIFFVDSDDIIDFNEFEKMYSEFLKESYDFGININSKKHYNGVIKSKNKFVYMLENQIINSPVGRLYKRDILIKNGITFNEKYSLGEDLLFNLQYFLKCKKAFYCNYDVYGVRNVNENSLTHKYRKNKFNELAPVNRECFSVCSNCDIKVLKALEYLKVKGCFSCLKDEIRNNSQNVYRYTANIKKNTVSKYVILNNLKTTLIHFLWFGVPVFVTVFVSIIIFGYKKQ